MKLLNLCSGAVRPQDEEWWNLDNLHQVLAPGTPERNNLDQEPRYVNFDALSGPLPFEDGTFDGIVASHCLEHWSCQDALKILRECRRVLKLSGIILISVPDSAYFRANWKDDTVENAERIFGEPIYLPDGERTFMGYALFNRFHQLVLSEDDVWCYLTMAGFIEVARHHGNYAGDCSRYMAKILNRIPFSLVMSGRKG